MTKYDDSVSPKKRTLFLNVRAGASLNKVACAAYTDGDAANNIQNIINSAVNVPGTFLCLGVSIDLGAETIVIYAGGSVAASTKSTAGTPPTTFGDTDRNFTIGRAHNDDLHFDGRIGEVGMWNRILTAGEFDYYCQKTDWRYL